MKKIFSASDETWELYKASKQAVRPVFPSKRTNNLDGMHGQVSYASPMPISGDHLHGEPESKAFKSGGMNDPSTPVDLDIKSTQEPVQSAYIRDNTIVPNREVQSNPVKPVTGMAAASVDHTSGASPLAPKIKEMEKSHRPNSEHDSTVVSDVVNPPGQATHKKLHKTFYDLETPDPQDGAGVAVDKVKGLGDPTGLEPVLSHKGKDIVHGQGIHVRDDVTD